MGCEAHASVDGVGGMAGDVEGGEGLDRRYVVVDETSSEHHADKGGRGGMVGGARDYVRLK